MENQTGSLIKSVNWELKKTPQQTNKHTKQRQQNLTQNKPTNQTKKPQPPKKTGKKNPKMWKRWIGSKFLSCTEKYTVNLIKSRVKKENDGVIISFDVAPGSFWAMRVIFILQKRVVYHSNFVFYSQKLSKIDSLINRWVMEKKYFNIVYNPNKFESPMY